MVEKNKTNKIDGGPERKLVRPDATSARPAATKSKSPGKQLWQKINDDFELNQFEEELLKQVCVTVDDIQSLEESTTPGDLESLRMVHAMRQFVVRSLRDLSHLQRERNPVGRPPRNIHWDGRQ